MTLREIIENLDRLDRLYKITGKTAQSNLDKDLDGIQHDNQKAWDIVLADYEEYLQDVENLIKTAKKRENHRISAMVRNLTYLKSNEVNEQKVNELRKMGYSDHEINALKNYMILKGFFERESRLVKDGKAKVNGRIKELLKRFEKVETYYLSVSTEAGNGKNNRKLFQKHNKQKA